MTRGIKKHNKSSALMFAMALMLAAAPRTGSAAPGGPGARPRLDVVFALDTTGSMAGELAAAKERIRSIAAALAAGEPAPVVRFGVLAFRDRGDTYVTKRSRLHADVERSRSFLASLQAEGGGDTPESVVQALHEALRKTRWDWSPETMRLVYLIGDAPPHRYPDEPDLDSDLRWALQRGVVVHALGCGGLDTTGREFFEQVSMATEGRYYALSDAAAAPAVGVQVAEASGASVAGRGGADALSSVVAGSARAYSSAVGSSFAEDRAEEVPVELLGTESWPAPGASSPLDAATPTGLMGSHARLVSDAATWQGLWEAHGSAKAGSESPPAVDFARHQVAVLYRPGRITSLQVQADELRRGLRYRVEPGGPTSARFVRLARTAQPMVFEALDD